MIRRAVAGGVILALLTLVPARAATPTPFALTVTVSCPGVTPLLAAGPHNYPDGYVVIVSGGVPWSPLVIRWNEDTYSVQLGADGGEGIWSRVAWTQDGLALATLGSAWYQVPVAQCANTPRPFPNR